MRNKLLVNEKELLFQLSQGSEQAFEKIYQFYSPRLYGKFIKLVKSEPVASELLQEVFLKIWELRQSIDPEKSFRSYIFKIAENKVYDFFRKLASDKKLREQLLKDGEEHYSHIEENMTRKENTIIVRRAIRLLPPQRQEIFRLCRLDGRSYKEVSGALGISTSTISDHIVKANHYIRSYCLAGYKLHQE